MVQRLGERWFVLRNMRARSEPVLLQPRYAMSYLRGPMTPVTLQRVLAAKGV